MVTTNLHSFGYQTGKTKDSSPNDSKHSLAAKCCDFLPEWDFDL
jgi:hypothetical protein